MKTPLLLLIFRREYDTIFLRKKQKKKKEAGREQRKMFGKEEVKVFLDKDFLEKEEIGVHPNDNTASVYLKTADLMQMIKEYGNSLEVLSFA